jgi:uncharacterized protein (TIGR04255 family)
MHEDVCYEKPFIKEVILRVDLPSPIPDLGKALPQRLVKKIVQRFPIAEPQTVKTREIIIDQLEGNLQGNTTESTKWMYHGKDREKTLTITHDLLLWQARNYVSYEDFTEDWQPVLAEFFAHLPDTVASRVGLRYVNIIEGLEDRQTLQWDDLIKEELLGLMRRFRDEANVSRVFQILEFNYEGQILKFQFGVPNPDYPAPIRRKQFVLDLDSYYQGALDHPGILAAIAKGHEKIQERFEASITDGLRTTMKKVV